MSGLLLLSCCAPCSCAVTEKFVKDKTQFSVLFFNPNIHPEAEYEKRRLENEKLCKRFNVPFISLPYEALEWRNAVKGLETEAECGERCSICFNIRLRRAAMYAKANGFEAFTSVLGISRHKDFNQVTTAGRQIGEELSIPYDDTNWRKGGLEQRRQQMISDLNLYTQDHCGCPFSFRDKVLRERNLELRTPRVGEG